MTDETYNGWTNRETWALNLWLSNDQGLYEMTRERVAAAVPRGWLALVTEAEAARTAGEAVKAFVEELTDPSDEYADSVALERLSMIREVDSLWRVDWDEIGAAWLESIEEG